MTYIFLVILFLLIYFINKHFLKKNVLLNYSGQIHQVFTGEKKVPLSGGIYILILFLFVFFPD